MKRVLVLVCLCVLLLSACTPKPVVLDFSKGANALDPSLAAEIDGIVEGVMQQIPLAGASVAVYETGEPVFVKAYGYANLDAEEMTTPETRYRFASVSKVMTGAAILQLVDKGDLALDTTVKDIWPDMPGNADQVTIEMLMSHTAGFPEDDPIIETLGWDVSQTYSAEERLELLRRIFSEMDINPDGTGLYSNMGITTLTMIVEEVSGMPWKEYFESNIAAPAGMTETTLCLSLPEGTAQGYANIEGEWLPMPPSKDFSSIGYGAGSMCGTASDLLRFHVALSDGTLIKVETYENMLEVVIDEVLGTTFGYGQTMMLMPPDGDLQYAGHIGGVDGYTTFMFTYPADGVYVAMTANTLSGMSTIAQCNGAQVAIADVVAGFE
jgi:D-alanyl-D-alanine carboxypeptidase